MEIHGHSKIRKVLLSPKLEGKAGRAHLAGILAYLDAGHVWDVEIVRSASELTPDAVENAIARGADGFLLSIPAPEKHRETMRILEASRVPAVILDCHADRAKRGRFSYVGFDTGAIVAAGLDYFSKKLPGAHVAFVPDASGEGWSLARRAAFEKLCSRRSLPHSVFPGGGRDDLAAWLEALPPPAGVLAANDLTALATVEACAARGIDVPERIAVLGIDNDELICGHARPPIATIEPNFTGTGFVAAETLQALMDGGRPPREVVVAESVNRIVVRQSARPSGARPALFLRAMDAIRSDAATLDLVRLAQRRGVSRTKLAESFAKAGTSVAAEIREARYAKVAGLLSDPNQAIGPIANICGWKSETHLMHSFRRRTGMTMREWRKRHLSLSRPGDGREKSGVHAKTEKRKIPLERVVRKNPGKNRGKPARGAH